jgi:neurotransmitter:Na+ symporter, NSS family
MSEHPREHWSSKLGFILAAIGSAIGLGVLWKFPYVVGQNGGGLFLLVYIICIVIIGVPVLIAELLIGRESQRAAVGAFQVLSKKAQSWRIAGWFGVASSFLIMSFYSVVAGWGMSYILMSLMGFSKGLSAQGISDVFDKLYTSGGICIFWHFLFTLITMGMVLSGVRKGIEKWAKIMTRALFVILIALFFYCINLDGFKPALRFIFEPNVAQFHFSTALEALGLAFFTLSLGQGIMISYGSYMKRDTNIPQMAGIVSVSVVIVAILAALIIFPVVFTFGFKPSEGPGLVFKTLPFLFAQLPGSLIVSTTFFVLFVFTAFTSSIPFVEVVATNLMELIGWTRKKAVLLVALFTFLFGIPSALAGAGLMFKSWPDIYGQNFLDTIDHFVSDWMIPIGGLLTTVFVGWILDKEAVHSAFNRRSWIGLVWRFVMRWVIPVLILLIILQKSGIIDFDKLLQKG